jgi:hypothetical protein
VVAGECPGGHYRAPPASSRIDNLTGRMKLAQQLDAFEARVLAGLALPRHGYCRVIAITHTYHAFHRTFQQLTEFSSGW